MVKFGEIILKIQEKMSCLNYDHDVGSWHFGNFLSHITKIIFKKISVSSALRKKFVSEKTFKVIYQQKYMAHRKIFSVYE